MKTLKNRKLQHLNVSGNNSDDLIDSIRPQIENLLELRSLSWYKPLIVDEENLIGWIESTLKWLGKTHHFLGVLEGKAISIVDHKKNRIPDGVSETERSLYSFNLAIQLSCRKLDARNYAYDHVKNLENLQLNKVVSLLQSCRLSLTNDVVKLDACISLKILNLSGNELTTVSNLGLEKLESLQCLDLANNKISDSIKDLGKVFNKLQDLEILVLKGNPCMRAKQKRLSMIGGTPSKKGLHDAHSAKVVSLLVEMPITRQFDCNLRIVDREITVVERIKAWSSSGATETEINEGRAQMALFLRTPKGATPENLQSLDLDGMQIDNLLLHRYTRLTTLLLRGNSLQTLKTLGLENLPSLTVLDVRDNHLDMDEESLTKHAKCLINCKKLKYLGLWCPKFKHADSLARVSSIAKLARKRRSSLVSTSFRRNSGISLYEKLDETNKRGKKLMGSIANYFWKN